MGLVGWFNEFSVLDGGQARGLNPIVIPNDNANTNRSFHEHVRPWQSGEAPIQYFCWNSFINLHVSMGINPYFRYCLF